MMIISELGTAFLAEGGIYDWIRRAFGKHMSTRAIYLYWLSNSIWMGANYVLFTGLSHGGRGDVQDSHHALGGLRRYLGCVAAWHRE
ncbi:MAG: hypothetical protein LBD01_02580 [Puniceicoccales bacterium]|nr:hypothetical protein [Puniceicoccales bacterium]